LAEKQDGKRREREREERDWQRNVKIINGK
jgi:hypothetical protein